MHAIDDLVRRFHDAVNAGDLDQLTGLMAPDVEIGGPRGTTGGPAAFRGWLERTGIALRIVDVKVRGRTAVVTQKARWVGDDQERTIAMVFVAPEDRITRVVRYDSVEDAVRAAGIAGGGGR